MRPQREMEQVRRLLELGLPGSAISRRTGVPPATVSRWGRGDTRAFGRRPMRAPWRPPDACSYAYLLGVYLGDGHITVTRAGKALLRITLDAAYPGIVDECRDALLLTNLRGKVQVMPTGRSRAFYVQSAWKRWVEVFPQHGPGRKHERPIVLERWQQAIVEREPGQFVRGLIHSDGCRTVNRFRTRLPSGRLAEYAYPRYFFSNLSDDIRRLFCEACDRLGVRWTQSNHRNISVSHRRSVAVLEDLVGPKR